MALEQIGLEAVIQDANFQAGIKRYIAGLAQANTSTSITADSTSSLGRIMETAIGSAIGFLTATAIPAMIRGLENMSSAVLGLSADYELTMSRISGLTATTAEQMQFLNTAVLDMAKDFPQSADELAQALYFISSSGYQGADAMNILRASAKAAAGGLGETKTIADAITSALNAYGASSSDAARYTDILVAAVREGKGEPDALAGAIGRVLPVASAMGVGFEEITASIATMTNTGLSAEEAATALRGTLSALLAPAAQSKDALSSLGLTTDDLRKSIREKGLLSTLNELVTLAGGSFSYTTELTDKQRASIDKLTTTIGTQKTQLSIYQQELQKLIDKHGEDSIQVQKKRLQIDKLSTSIAANQGNIDSMNASVGKTVTGNRDMFETLDLIIPNIRALTGVLSTSVAQGDSYVEILDAMKNATGATDKAFETASKTWDFQTKQLKNNFDIIKISIGAPLLEAFKPAIQAATDFIQQLSETGQIKAFAESLAEVASNILPLIQGFADTAKDFADTGDLGVVFDDLNEMIPGLKENLGDVQKIILDLFRGISPQANETFTTLGEKAYEIGKEIMPFVNEQIAKFGAWWNENGPLVSEYISVIIKDFGTFAGIVLDSWMVIAPVLDGLITLVLDIAKIVMQVRIGKWSEAWKSMGKLVANFAEAVKKTILGFGNWVASWFKTNLDNILKTWSNNWNMLKGIVAAVIKNITKSISDWLTGIVKDIKDKFDSALDTVRSVWRSIGIALQKAISDMYKYVTSGLEGIRQTLQAVWNFIFLDTGTKWKLITGVVSSALDNAKAFFSDKLNTLKNIIAGVWQSIQDAAKTAWNNLVQTIVGLIQSIPTAVRWIVSQLSSIGTSIVDAIKNGIINVWYSVTGVAGILSNLLGGLAGYVFSGNLLNDIMAIGGNIISAIRSGIINAWYSGTSIVSSLVNLLSNLVTDLWTGNLWTRIQAAGSRIIDNIISGIQSNWSRFVEWLQNAIGGIFGSSYSVSSTKSSQAFSALNALSPQAVTQYSSTTSTSNTFNLYVSSIAPTSTVVQDFATMQAIASV